jgi:putative ABC transport system permease protein
MERWWKALPEAEISLYSLAFSSVLVAISLAISLREHLKLEKDIIISILRAIVQLVAVGYVLQYVFGLESFIFTFFLLATMILNAAYNSKKRGKGIENAFLISFASIGTGTAVTLGILVLTGTLRFIPSQMIPVGGMIISNSMIAIGLSYRFMGTAFKDRRNEVETKLSLGASPFLASREIVKESIRTAMMPTVDSAKTLGIVSLPGMMSGLILAGASPLTAIRYQIMVTFMLLSTTAIAAFIACYLAYRGYFNSRSQLKA